MDEWSSKVFILQLTEGEDPLIDPPSYSMSHTFPRAGLHEKVIRLFDGDKIKLNCLSGHECIGLGVFPKFCICAVHFAPTCPLDLESFSCPSLIPELQ